MKRIVLWILWNLALGYFAEAQKFEWAKRAGLWAYDYGYGIITDNAGNIYLSGKYEMEANFSGTVVSCEGNHDIYLAKYTPSGSLAWVRTAGGYTGDYATCVATDNSFVYIGGEIEGAGAKISFSGSAITLTCQGSNDIFIAKYDLNGNLIWARRAGDIYYEKALGIATDNSGNVYVCGLYNTTATFGGTTTISGYGENDIFLAKYDANGNFLWVRKAGGPARDEAKSIGIDGSGNVYICGLFKNSADFSGTIINSNGYFDMFLAKYSSDGNLQWVKKAGSSWDDVGWSLAIDNADKIFVTGEFNSAVNFGGITLTTAGSADVFVARYNSSGNIEWAKRAGGNLADRARGIGTDGNNIYITGQYSNTATFGTFTATAADSSDIFITALSNDGNFLWTSTVGGTPDPFEDLGYESGNAICADANGNVFATGAILNGGIFGNTSLNPYERTDIFIARLLNDTLTGSGDTLATDTTEADTGSTELIAAGSLWKFLDDGSDQGTAWKEISFNDASWKTGNAELGYGDGDETTVVAFGPNSSYKYVTTYFRKSFNIPDTSGITGLELSLIRDDGAVVYINGVEVTRDNMPSGIIYYNTFAPTSATATESVYQVSNISSSFLVNGTNYVAVEMHQATWSSSDLSFNLKLKSLSEGAGGTDTLVTDTSVTDTASMELIAVGSLWKYLDNGSDQGTAWKEILYNDAAWKTGNAELGYGDGDETTVISFGPNTDSKYITTYFRKTFEIPDASAVSDLELSLIRDDGAVIYINGAEVKRDNMPSGTINYNTLASSSATSTESVYQVSNISSSFLVNGTNLISAELHQSSIKSSDLSFNLKLTVSSSGGGSGSGSSELIAASSSWKYFDNGDTNDSTWKSSSYNDSIWKTGNAEFGYGDGDETTVVSYGSSSSNKYITTYFRKTFNVINVSTITGLELSLIRDDGAVVYINGVEVNRNNMPSGIINYNTLALNSSTASETVYQVASIGASSLVNGTNLMAVEIHQHSANSSDISFNLKLRAISGAKMAGPPDENRTELLSFSGEEKNNYSYLSWKMSGEKNNHYFIIEKSADEINFNAIGIVMGAGNSENEKKYFFVDSAFTSMVNRKGVRLYYRLNLTDYDGRATYSPVISITAAPLSNLSENGNPVTFNIYPNPLKHSFTFSFSEKPGQGFTLYIYDISGKIISETILMDDQSQIDVSSFEPGIYLVGIKSGDAVIFSEKIIVQK